MKKNLRSKLSISYVFLALTCVLLISYLSNFFLKKQFNNYVIEQHEQKNKAIVTSVNQEYNNGNWNVKLIESIGINALDSGLLITVRDIDNNIIWDANSYDHGECQVVIDRLAKNMFSAYPNWKGQLVNTKYNLTSNTKNVGKIEIQYYGPLFYNDNDLMYLKTLNKILIGVGITSLIIALIIALIMTNSLSVPILKVIDAAKLISKGSYNKRLNKKSNIYEIDELMYTINELGDSLIEQEALRTRLTRDVSHELRTPLTTLQSHLEALIDGVWQPTEERLKSCHEETLRLIRLVGDLEELSFYESENLILNKSNFNIGEVINNIVLNFEKKFLNKGVEIIFSNRDVNLYADKDKISQVVINLISNALKYTEKCGVVEINIENAKKFIYISVKDTGIGISKEDIPYVFERFYRADKSRNRLTGGAGIGLTIVKAIVEAHKGTIIVNSKIDNGTEFKVQIPNEL